MIGFTAVCFVFLLLSRYPNAIAVLGLKHICDNVLSSALNSMALFLGHDESASTGLDFWKSGVWVGVWE